MEDFYGKKCKEKKMKKKKWKKKIMIFYQMLFEIPIFLFVFGLQNSAKEFFSNGKFFDNFLGIFFLFCDF